MPGITRRRDHQRRLDRLPHHHLISDVVVGVNDVDGAAAYDQEADARCRSAGSRFGPLTGDASNITVTDCGWPLCKRLASSSFCVPLGHLQTWRGSHRPLCGVPPKGSIMIRTLSLTIAIVLALALTSSAAHAYGYWQMVQEGTANYWDFSVGKGEFCWVDYTGGPYYNAGSTACASGSLGAGTVDHVSDFSRGGTFPFGHAERIAVGEGLASTVYGVPKLLVATTEGYLYAYETIRAKTLAITSWFGLGALPSSLPVGMGPCSQGAGCAGGYGVTRLIYESLNYYTGQAATNPVWLLGSDNHVYRLVGSGIGKTWQDVSDSYGIGTVAQLSYSAAFEAIVATFSNGSSIYYDDNYNEWFEFEPASSQPLATDFSWDQYFQRNFYAAGGVYESWCSSHLSGGGCSFTFQLGNYDGSGWTDVTSATAYGSLPIYCNPIDENWSVTVLSDFGGQQTPINVVEGSFLQFGPYGGGPNVPGWQDLVWVQTSELRVYVFEMNGPC